MFIRKFLKFFRDLWMLLPWRQNDTKDKARDFIKYPLTHRCALDALFATLPNISSEEVERAFLFCSSAWPHGGVRYYEFNKALRYLKIRDKFEYIEKQGAFSQFQKDCKNTYILLIPGHYTVLAQGKLRDKGLSYLGPKTSVFRAWKLL